MNSNDFVTVDPSTFRRAGRRSLLLTAASSHRQRLESAAIATHPLRWRLISSLWAKLLRAPEDLRPLLIAAIAVARLDCLFCFLLPILFQGATDIVALFDAALGIAPNIASVALRFDGGAFPAGFLHRHDNKVSPPIISADVSWVLRRHVGCARAGIAAGLRVEAEDVALTPYA